MLRKGTWAAAGMIPTIIAASYMPRYVLYGFLIFLALTVTVFLFYRLKGRFVRVFFLLCAALVGLISFVVRYELTYAPILPYDQSRISASVVFTQQQSDKWIVEVKDAHCEGEEVHLPHAISMYIYSDNVLQYDYGEISFTLTVEDMNPLNNEYVSADDVEIHSLSHGASPSIWNRMTDFRQSIVTTIRNYVGGDEGDLVAAILTGDKNNLSASVQQAFRKTGLTHVMAVSGLHLSIITGTVVYFLNRLEFHRKLVYSLALGLTFLVAVLGGFSISIMRAAMMSGILYMTALIQKNADSLNSLGVAVTIMTLLSPFSVMSLAFMLSVSATFGILWLSPKIEEKITVQHSEHYKHKRQIQLLAVSVSSFIFTAPILILYIRELSIVSVPIMMLLNLPITLLLIFTVIFCIISFVPFFGGFFAFILRILADFILKVTTTVSTIAPTTISFYSPPALIFAVLGAILLIVFLLRKRISHYRICSFLVIMAMLVNVYFVFDYTNKSSSLVVLEGSNGACTLYMDKGKAVVIDCSNNSLAYQAQALLKQRGFYTIDIMIVTGFNDCLARGVDTLLQYMPAKTVLLPSGQENNEYFRRITEASGYAQSTVVPFSEDIRYSEYHLDLISLEKEKNNISVIINTDNQKIAYISTINDEIIASCYKRGQDMMDIDTLVIGANTTSKSIDKVLLSVCLPKRVIPVSTSRRFDQLHQDEINAIQYVGASLLEPEINKPIIVDLN